MYIICIYVHISLKLRQPHGSSKLSWVYIATCVIVWYVNQLCGWCILNAVQAQAISATKITGRKPYRC